MHTELAAVIQALPNTAGVYYFYGAQDQLLYVGKSIHIKKRVQQHFTAKDRKSLKIQHFTTRIHYEVMGSELVSLLYESALIKKHQPLYNRSQRRTIYTYGLYENEQHGYKQLLLQKSTTDKEELIGFSSLNEGKTALFRFTEKHRLCQKINGLYHSTGSCFQFQIKECNGACIGKELPADYNKRVLALVNDLNLQNRTHLFELTGRTAEEIALVYIEKGVYKGFGFCPTTTKKEDRLLYITPYQDTKDARRILKQYFLKNTP